MHSVEGWGAKIVGKSTTQSIEPAHWLDEGTEWVVWSFDWNSRVISFDWINGLLGYCSLDWISGILSILSYKECSYIHRLVYVRYLASQLTHSCVDHVSTAWCPPPLPPGRFGWGVGVRPPPPSPIVPPLTPPSMHLSLPPTVYHCLVLSPSPQLWSVTIKIHFSLIRWLQHLHYK